jgi:glycosyltransferase involved in cell wall biosynthesis
MSELISVIIPVYNGEKYLAEAIESALAQTYAPLEVIVIDDGSTDASAQIAKQYSPVRYAAQTNCGISASRNRGVQLAQGEFFAFLDADDIWLPNKLALQTRALAANANLGMVFGYAQEFISPELATEVANRIQCEPEPRPGVLPSATLVRREAYAQIGDFEARWKAGEFANWILRANEVEVMYRVIPELVVRRRLHTANNGIRNREEFNDYARMIKASLDRRRAAEGKQI